MSVSKEFFEKQVLGLLGALEGAARRLTRNEADAEDLVAETVSRAWRSLRRRARHVGSYSRVASM